MCIARKVTFFGEKYGRIVLPPEVMERLDYKVKPKQLLNPRELEKVLKEWGLNDKIVYFVMSEVIGYSWLEPLMRDEKLEDILKHPTPENFLQKSREFAVETGLATEDVQEIFEELERLPVIGYAQNMIGRACHALTLRRYADEAAARLRSAFPEHRVEVHEIGNEIRVSDVI